MPNEIDEFFKGLPAEDKKEADVFNDKSKATTEEVVPKVDDKKEDDVDGKKNRRHRRLEEKLQSERESNIALAERVKILSEQQQFERETKHEGLDPDLVRVFGDTDAGKEVARIMAEKIALATETAEERALKKFEERQLEAQREQKEFESFIDSELESLEDQHNIDLTSDSPQARKARREFLEMVQNLSPKDENGTITAYADFDSTFNVYQSTHQEKVDASRQKEIASRSMQRSTQNAETPQNITRGFHGWKKDYNIN